MKKIDLLDCTLRDGGYVNEWKFGNKNIKKIIENLVLSNVEIVECGFLTNKVLFDSNISQYSSVDVVSDYLPEQKKKSIFVCMVNFGEYDAENIPNKKDTCLDGIRVAFHKKDMVSALRLCREIQEKGYKVFLQPMVSLSYSESEFNDLLRHTNELSPYAFYIVDSFGSMRQTEVRKLLDTVKFSLSEQIKIGFHCHNNMQLAYSNAQCFIENAGDRNVIIDSSIYGMGRGAGNLNTELIMEYLNQKENNIYDLKPIIRTMDEVLYYIYNNNYWGYSLPYYLSAKYNCHPNYASHIIGKNSLTVQDTEELLNLIDNDKKTEYDREYIEKKYIEYQTKNKYEIKKSDILNNDFIGKEIIVIAPGKSAELEKYKIINKAAQKNIITLAVNYYYSNVKLDYIFISNARRYNNLSDKLHKIDCKIITTSNIHEENRKNIIVDYSDLVGEISSIEDNAGIMVIKLLSTLGVKKIWLAGFDGYSINTSEDYINDELALYTEKNRTKEMNDGMSYMLTQSLNLVDIEFLTTPVNVNFENRYNF